MNDTENINMQPAEETTVRTAINTDEGKKKTSKTAAEPVNRPADPYIWGIFLILAMISLVITYDASSREVSGANIYAPLMKQGSFLVAGTFIMLSMQRINYQRFIPFIPLFAIVTLGLLAYVQMFGEVINGARRNITLLGFSLQPAEMAKLGVILLIALIMSKNQMVKGVKNAGVIWSAIVVITFGVLIFKQGLTNTLLLMFTSAAMMLISGVQWKKIGLLLLIFGTFCGIYFGISKIIGTDDDEAIDATEVRTEQVAKASNGRASREGTWRNRILRHLDTVPLYKKELNAINQQEMFSRMAQANGGITGVGPGNSRESSRLPLAFSDYIYSIIVEDTGLIGGLVLIAIYLMLLARAGHIAQRCKRAFPALMVIGMAVLIVMQALFHMAINVGFFPVSGQPLPFISMGGTSILIMSMAMGIMLSVSRTARTVSDKSTDIKDELNKLPDNMQGENQGLIK